MKLFIDAGHGAADSGAVGIGGRLEKHDNLALALSLSQSLTELGHQVKLSRTSDAYPTLKDRAQAANDFKADLFISLHRNSAGESANGVEVLYCPGASQTSQNLANSISKAIANACGFRNRGAKCQRAYVLEHTKMPAVTIESGFVTNSSDNLKYDSNQKALIDAIISAIEGEFGLTPPPAAEPAADDLRYKTKQGAKLWIFEGCPEAGTEVNLEAYWMGDEYARISDDAGAEYLIKWDDLEKA